MESFPMLSLCYRPPTSTISEEQDRALSDPDSNIHTKYDGLNVNELTYQKFFGAHNPFWNKTTRAPQMPKQFVVSERSFVTCIVPEQLMPGTWQVYLDNAASEDLDVKFYTQVKSAKRNFVKLIENHLNPPGPSGPCKQEL